MTAKTRLFLCIALVMSFSVACGMTAVPPSRDGQLGVKLSKTATHIDTSPTAPDVLESVFVVTADSLQIRPCPYKDDETCPPYQRGFIQGDVVMGFCRTFEDGSIWLEFDGQKYAAVYFDGAYLMMGDCP